MSVFGLDSREKKKGTLEIRISDLVTWENLNDFGG